MLPRNVHELLPRSLMNEIESSIADVELHDLETMSKLSILLADPDRILNRKQEKQENRLILSPEAISSAELDIIATFIDMGCPRYIESEITNLGAVQVSNASQRNALGVHHCKALRGVCATS